MQIYTALHCKSHFLCIKKMLSPVPCTIITRAEYYLYFYFQMNQSQTVQKLLRKSSTYFEVNKIPFGIPSKRVRENYGN